MTRQFRKISIACAILLLSLHLSVAGDCRAQESNALIKIQRFAEVISRAGLLRVNLPSGRYTLDAAIPVHVLFNIDVFQLGQFCVPEVPANVVSFYHYFQTNKRIAKSPFKRTDNSEIVYVPDGDFPLQAVCRRGTREVQVQVEDQFKDIPQTGQPFKNCRENSPPQKNYCKYAPYHYSLLGADVVHYTIPWYVRDEAIQALQ